MKKEKAFWKELVGKRLIIETTNKKVEGKLFEFKKIEDDMYLVIEDIPMHFHNTTYWVNTKNIVLFQVEKQKDRK